jgi:hypothetical protein
MCFSPIFPHKVIKKFSTLHIIKYLGVYSPPLLWVNIGPAGWVRNQAALQIHAPTPLEMSIDYLGINY